MAKMGTMTLEKQMDSGLFVWTCNKKTVQTALHRDDIQ